MNISGLRPIIPIDPASIAPVSGASSTEKSSFKDVLSGAINQVESSRTDAAKSVDQFLSGEGDDLHSTILSGQRAELEFQLFMQVRNKVVAAYSEIMKMQM